MANIKLETEESSVNVGDFFLDKKDKEVYLVAQSGPEEYILICLNDGKRWASGAENIEEIFGNCRGRFVKITKSFTVTP